MTATLTDPFRSRIEEFFNPNHDRLGKFAKTRAGKGFGGVSVPRDVRIPPTPKFKLPPTPTQMDAAGIDPSLSPKERKKAFVKTFFEFNLPDGHRSVVTSIIMSDGQVDVTGEIQDKHGSRKGGFQREMDNMGQAYDAKNIEESKYGPDYPNYKHTSGYSVNHTSFELTDSRQGSGIGSAFISASVAKYREMGIDHVTVYAGDTVGGYVWAREGFRIEDGNKNMNPFNSSGSDWMWKKDQFDTLAMHADEHLVELEATAVLPAYAVKEARSKLTALRDASEAGEDVQPIHIASIGEDGPRYQGTTVFGETYETWPGKEMLMGRSWQGTYYFGEPLPSVQAAAREHFGFDPTQPRDKEGQWTRHRAGITSLSQNTLDRALNKGIDGIFGAGPTGGVPWPTAPRQKKAPLYDKELVQEALSKPPVLEKVDPRILYATQPGLTRGGVEYYGGDEYRTSGRTFADRDRPTNAFPVVYVNRKGQHILLIGHHRAAADLIAGRDLDAIVVRET